MFSKLALFAAASLAVFVVALPSSSGIDSICGSNHIYCCDDVEPASSNAAQQAIKRADIQVAISGTVGLTCKHIAVNEQRCTPESQQACCNGVDYSDGAVVVDCSTINFSA